MYVVTVTFDIKDGQFSAFREVIRKNAAASRNEPNCHLFDVCFSDDKKRCFLYELYTDRAGFDFHRTTAHFLEFDEASKPLFSRKEAEFWTMEPREP